MHAAQGGSQEQHETMMQHAGMNHADIDMSMDCCEHDSEDSAGQCDPVSQCRAPAFSYVMFDVTTVNDLAITRQHHSAMVSSPESNQFPSPPLRPPIS